MSALHQSSLSSVLILGFIVYCLGAMAGWDACCDIVDGGTCWGGLLGAGMLLLVPPGHRGLFHANLSWLVLLVLVACVPRPAVAMQLSTHGRLTGAACGSEASATCVGLAPGVLRRPVPTPCRTRNRDQRTDRVTMWIAGQSEHALPDGPLQDTSALSDRPMGTADEFLSPELGDIGPTLLEQAIADPESPALYLACTLLETLQEHFSCKDASPDGRAVDRGAASLTVRIYDHLPVTRTFDLSPVSLYVGCTLDDVVEVTKVGSWQLCPMPCRVEPTVDQWIREHGQPTDHFPADACDVVDVYTDGSFNGSSSAWAFHATGRVGTQCCSLGWFGGVVRIHASSSDYIGAGGHSALNGELSALLWCIGWALQLPATARIAIHSDCNTAIGLSAGRMGKHSPGSLAALCRAGYQALASIGGPHRIVIHHIKSHVGHLANEVADRLAKFMCKVPCASPAVPAPALKRIIKGGWLPWLWLYLESACRPQCWPQQLGGAFLDTGERPFEVPTSAECAEMLGLPHGGNPPRRGSEEVLQALLLTVNVQSLRPVETGPPLADGFHGRAQFLREQLDALKVAVAGLQETRSRANEMIPSSTHIRFCSAKDAQGAHGIELWFSKRHPLVSSQSAPVYFKEEDFLAVHWDPRILAIRFARASLRILFVSIHAPTNNDGTRADWWRSLFELLSRLRQECQIVLLGDFNLHLDTSYGDHVGDLTWPTDKAAPPSFWKILRSFGLWIPSTFSCCHPGPSVTWRAPGGNATSRLDYIAVPQQWGVPSHGSWVVPELDWGQDHTDHFALAVRAQAHVRLSKQCSRHRPRLNTQQMRTPEGRTIVSQICASVPLQPWDLDVHRHAAAIERHLGGLLSVAFPAPRARQQKEYFSACTWQLRSKRAWLRKRIHHATTHGQNFSLRAAFRAWRLGRPLWCPTTCAWERLLRILKLLPQHVASLRGTSPALKQSIKADVSAYLHEVAVSSVSAPTKDTVQRLRSLTGGPKRKQRGLQPLPAVEVEPGRLAGTQEEAKDRWIQHFAAMEDGHLQEATVLVRQCYRRQRAKDLSQHCLELCQTPCLGELEAAMREANVDRAYGLDGIPGEVLKFGSSTLSLPIYQLLLKLAFRLSEPIQHKGGTLHFVWKGKGPRQSCAAYRGILVASVIGKTLHKVLRQHAVHALGDQVSPLQVGGLPAYPVSVPAHAARLFQSGCRRHSWCHALLFLDLQEAFYRIVRPLITGEVLSDEEVARVCAAVKLPPDTMHELHQHLGRGPLLQTAGISSWASEAVSETLRDTWFRLPHQPEIVATRAGSRPGDSLSDLVFSFLFAKVLSQLRASLHRSGHIAAVPWDPAMINALTLLDREPSGSISLSDSTWMDDLALMLKAKRASDLVEILRQGASCLIDECLGRALVPNLAKGKTEAVVSVRSSGSRVMRRHLFGELGGRLPLDCRLHSGARLQLVPVYRHLGGMIQHDGGLGREVRFRIAQAWDAFNRRKRKLFGSPLVPIADKRLLFDTLVTTVLFYGAGTWSEVPAQQLDSLTNAIRQMACRMLRPMYTCEQAWHLGTSQVLALAGMLDVVTYIHLARLRYVLSCVRLAIPEIWALAQWERSWLGQLGTSVRWLWEFTDAGAEFPTHLEAWTAWTAEARASPGRWKTRLRKHSPGRCGISSGRRRPNSTTVCC